MSSLKLSDLILFGEIASVIRALLYGAVKKAES